MEVDNSSRLATLKWLGLVGVAAGVCALAYAVFALLTHADAGSVAGLAFGGLGCILGGGTCASNARARLQRDRAALSD